MRLLSILVLASAAVLAAQQRTVTFHRDIQPLVQERCQGCHRAGEIGPMPLGSYEEVPKGTFLRADAVFDNSPANRFNPDRTATVR